MINISQRGHDVAPSPMRQFYEMSQKAMAEGKYVYFLNIGQPDIHTPFEYFKELRGYSDKVVRYAPAQGFPEVLDAWQEYYFSCGINVDTDNIVVTAGGSEALQFAIMAAADPGDEIIIFEPTYPSYFSFAKMLGVHLITIPRDSENSFHLPSSSAISKLITKKTKAILIDNPANPTGTVLTKKEVRELSAIAQKHNLFIIADEVYREFIYTDSVCDSFMNVPHIADRVIMVDSVSKRFSLCGARVGALVSLNKDIIESVIRFAQSRLSIPTAEQLAVIPLLRHGGKHIASVVEEYTRRRETMISSFRQMTDVGCAEPEGAFYSMVTLPVEDVVDFVSWTVSKFHDNKETVLISPGTGFYSNPIHGKQQARIAFVLESERLARALELLRKALKQYLQLKK